MTAKQRLDWDAMQYRRKLEANKGSNYEYWNEKHDRLLEKGYDLFAFTEKSTRQWNKVFTTYSTTSESHAKKAVNELREAGNYARIVCGYTKTMQRTKHYSVIFKDKKNTNG